MEEQLTKVLQDDFGLTWEDATPAAVYAALHRYTQQQMEAMPPCTGKKKLYYVSAEFLMGKLLSNNLINLRLFDEAKAVLKSHGFSLEEIEEQEPEPSLGNGGLGRLAACFLDSIATLNLPGDGAGLCYRDGLFRQRFVDLKQQEEPNPWITPERWITDTGVYFDVPFGFGTLRAHQYDMLVPGYNGHRNTLHLFDLDSADEAMIRGGIDFDKTDIAHNLTLFLYPDDSDEPGRLLRVYQQYFLVSATAQLILKEVEARGGSLHKLHEYAVVQINDTHPTMIIPEFIRLLTEKGVPLDDAIDEVSKTCAYTNHTILAEALEKWPKSFIETVAPGIVPIIEELDKRVKEKFDDPRVYILDDHGLVHMVHIDIHYGFSVNGVAALHTEILKSTELKHFYDLYPEKFNNKTNGITFRRWLLHSNPRLTGLLDETIGTGYRADAMELTKLLAFQDDAGALKALEKVKAANKKDLAAYLKASEGVDVDPQSVFDIQIKRLHEYKRQQMNALWAVHQYLEIKAGRLPRRPITVIFGAKAAPAYTIAKDIIHLILCLSRLIAEDPQVRPWLKVVMVENYNVSKATRLIPACDLSEQISLASKEASGTGNMKFMLNGAVTLGTRDGANVEIEELVGEENIYTFGASSEEVIGLYAKGAYSAAAIYESDPQIQALVDFIVNKNFLLMGDPVSLVRLYRDVRFKDWFMALLDLKDYIAVKERALSDFEDCAAWTKKSLVNIAKAGYFSSDRTIEQYNHDIWRL